MPNFSFLACLEVAEKFGGVGAKTRFLSKKKLGKNIGSGGGKYWVSLPYIHGCNLDNLTNLATSRHARMLKFGPHTH